MAQWLADGTTLVAVSDESGEERVEVFEDGAARTLPWDIGRVRRDARRAARRAGRDRQPSQRSADRRPRRPATLTVVDRSDAGRSEDLAWSPDGAWLAYTFWTEPAALRDQAARRRRRRRSTLVTQPEFRDYCPAFDPEGKYLYFLSVRTFDPVYDSVQFELSFPARGAAVPDRAAGRRSGRRSIRRRRA